MTCMTRHFSVSFVSSSLPTGFGPVGPKQQRNECYNFDLPHSRLDLTRGGTENYEKKCHCTNLRPGRDSPFGLIRKEITS